VLIIFFLEDSVLDKYTAYQVSTVLLALLVPGEWVNAKFSKEISSNHTLCRKSIFVPVTWGANFREAISTHIIGPRAGGEYTWIDTAKGHSVFHNNPFGNDYVVIPYKSVDRTKSPRELPIIKSGFPFLKSGDKRKERFDTNTSPSVLTLSSLLELVKVFGDNVNRELVNKIAESLKKTKDKMKKVDSKLFGEFLEHFSGVEFSKKAQFVKFVKNFQCPINIKSSLGNNPSFEEAFRHAKKIINSTGVGIEVADGQHRLYTVSCLLSNGGVVSSFNHINEDTMHLCNHDSRYITAIAKQVVIHADKKAIHATTRDSAGAPIHVFSKDFLVYNKNIGKLLADELALYEELPLSAAISRVLSNIDSYSLEDSPCVMSKALEDMVELVPQLMMMDKEYRKDALDFHGIICKTFGKVCKLVHVATV